MSEQVGYCAWCGRNVEAESPAAQPQVREALLDSANHIHSQHSTLGALSECASVICRRNVAALASSSGASAQRTCDDGVAREMAELLARNEKQREVSARAQVTVIPDLMAIELLLNQIIANRVDDGGPCYHKLCDGDCSECLARKALQILLVARDKPYPTTQPGGESK